MRNLESHELEKVHGGFRVVIAGGAVIAWAFANRASLKAIKDAAVAEHRRLTAEHAEN